MSDRTDSELLAAYARNERGAFDEIVTRYERRVYAIAMRMCGPEDARDVMQEVFIDAMRALRKFRGDAALGTWFHRVAVNASLDTLRRRKRRPVTSIDAIGERPDDRAGPEEHALAASRAAAVQRALTQISDEHRAVLVLGDLHGLDYAAIAEALDIPVGTVKSRIHRARAEMARLLGHLRTEPNEVPDPLRKRP